ncbi:MAG: protein kinase [Lachnospiraceae bacterium]|nr:protein kinase [Lachnospiraceae bacterium]
MDYENLLRETFDNVVQIGAGGGGTVFRARHKRLDKDVVLKRIHTSHLRSIDHRAELDILKNLKSSYLPQIIDFIEFGDAVFTVMEYIPGKSFAELLEEGYKFSKKDIARWLRQIAEVVDYLHSQKPPIIHCDIKPANIMLTPDNNICLIDFNISGVKTEEGIAAIGYSNGYAPAEQFAMVAERLKKRFSTAPVPVQAAYAQNDFSTGVRTETDEATQIDTQLEPAFISASGVNGRTLMKALSDSEWMLANKTVEELNISARVDERSDIYSIGATFYHIAAGVRTKPFFEKNIPIEELRPDLGDGIAYVINKSMEIRPQDRFKDGAQLLKVVGNLGKNDRRYRSINRRETLCMVLCMALLIASVLSMVFGRSSMRADKDNEYSAYMEALADAREGKDTASFEEIYNRAISLKPQEAEAYYQKALMLYELKDYNGCIEYIDKDVYQNAAIPAGSSLSAFDYVTGNCLFETGDYTQAVSYFERALKNNPDEINVYRDYVVSLARKGDIDKAKEVLETARKKEISGDIISLLEGEIALQTGDYYSGEAAFIRCIEATEDDYMKLRAYTQLDEVYEKQSTGKEGLEKRIDVLSGGVEALPAEYRATLMERLAQAYIDYSDIEDTAENCLKAIDVFNEMDKLGYGTFTSRYNVAVLYDKAGMLSEAIDWLNNMLLQYPDNYVIYKRLAFVEAEVQLGKSGAQRNFAAFREYYDAAQKLYAENAKGQDMEMLSLQELYEDVVSNGW